MTRMCQKLTEVVKLSVRSQLEMRSEEKANRLIEMLELIAKGTKYERDVYEALENYHQTVDKENNNA
ncbi:MULTISPECIES: hypothetical protein [unclassified Paenibacillus]|uniref:hypothetical protein n=1 Tax=unclassified Paenibacillus TaxID=185978 RepID=UPI0009A676D4|nr:MULTISPECIES: hypothetical protein [unclassified Paenibacillus]SLJ98330.1 hypothetical protein SAMN06272722_102732 [Paenibacillus sp. RU5A]SOC66783.1 hypothetical protein SAMN05880581_102265 [Paenibacillus sp. RU26A]SOC70068.1 hypothetical protein SAMN05880586_102732 [Paenibacillus sp. RU5M]